MQRHDAAVRQGHAWVQLRERRVVPGADFALVDAGQRRAVQLKGLRYARQVAIDGLRRDCHRDVQDAGMATLLLAGHERVRCADLHRTAHSGGDALLRA